MASAVVPRAAAGRGWEAGSIFEGAPRTLTACATPVGFPAAGGVSVTTCGESPQAGVSGWSPVTRGEERRLEARQVPLSDPVRRLFRSGPFEVRDLLPLDQTFPGRDSRNVSHPGPGQRSACRHRRPGRRPDYAGGATRVVWRPAGLASVVILSSRVRSTFLVRVFPAPIAIVFVAFQVRALARRSSVRPGSRVIDVRPFVVGCGPRTGLIPAAVNGALPSSSSRAADR